MKFFLPFLVILLFSNCSNTLSSQEKFLVMMTKENKEHLFHNLNDTVVDLGNQLFSSSRLQNSIHDKTDVIKVLLTSFVNLDNFEDTSTFGRLISESMFNELHIRNFKVIDFRGQDAVSVNEDGEFHITRDTTKLKDTIESTEFILVGTYVNFEENKQVINARIIDSISGDVISTARVVYQKKDIKNTSSVQISIIADKCAQVNCPQQQCKDGICDNSVLY